MPSGCCCCCCKIYYKTHSGRAPKRKMLPGLPNFQTPRLPELYKFLVDTCGERGPNTIPKSKSKPWWADELPKSTLWWGSSYSKLFPQKISWKLPISMCIYLCATDIWYAWYWVRRVGKKECSLNEDANVSQTAADSTQMSIPFPFPPIQTVRAILQRFSRAD